MSVWEYKLVRIDAETHGIFVCRGTEWRLLLTVTGILSTADMGVSIGGHTAFAIARAMGWDVPLQSVVADPLATLDPHMAAAAEIVEKIKTAVEVPSVSEKQSLGTIKKLQDPGLPKSAPSPVPVEKPKWEQWTEEPEKRLRQHRGNGLSYKVIAELMTKEFGKKFTSSMCSAKADRMGLQKHPFIGGRPAKGKVEPKASEPAQDAKTEAGGETDDGNMLPAPAVGSESSSVDAGAHPAAGIKLADVAGANGIAKGIPAYPAPIRDSIGYWPQKPALSAAVEWYREQNFRVFKIRPGSGDFKLQVNGGELLTPEEFIEPVNALREELGLPVFDLSA